MKPIFLVVVATIAAAALAACNQTASNGNSAMNRAGMSNGSSNSMNHNSMPMNSNMPGMDHSSMQSSPNAASAPYDLQFIDTMTAHHESAIDMAKLAATNADNAELKKFAEQIIADQNKEIGQMKDWREKWFSAKPPAMNMEMPGMMDSMKMDMSKLSNSKGKAFDLAFVEMMTSHHNGAVTMAKEALTTAERPEIKTLANTIIKAQEAEVKMMNGWKEKWSK